MTDRIFSEEELTRMEGEPAEAHVRELVHALREQQRTLERLHLTLDVSVRDRDQLRSELIACREEVRRLSG